MSEYSGTPLAEKLGMKPGFRVCVNDAPPNYESLLAPLPEDVQISTGFRSDVDMWHLFTTSRRHLVQQLPLSVRQIRQDGMIWVSWPKKASGVPTDVSEDTVRAAAIPLGLVDVKVCAVDDVWSGLKLVIRKENRV